MYLVLCPLDGRDIHVVGGGAHIFILLVGEDVNTNQINLQYLHKMHCKTSNNILGITQPLSTYAQVIFKTNYKRLFLEVLIENKTPKLIIRLLRLVQVSFL